MNASNQELRAQFLDYFASHQHTKVPSSSLVPPNDPSLLFTNSGMVQFKDIFLGKEEAEYLRACSCQRCLRVGGKHNDLEMVGHTQRHLTLFEMLGNFSFGDYFKQQAIEYAWRFVTRGLALDIERLWVTVHSHDAESLRIWRKVIGLPEHKVLCLESRDNFWQMGNTGPAGYCSEIFYDQGDKLFGGLPGASDQDGDRYTELWNLVFMEFNLTARGAREPLAMRSVDTGMGLDRLESILQGVSGVFKTNSFMELKEAIAANLGVSKARRESKEYVEVALNVIADHTRAATMMIYDGVYPSNEGRGYVLRRVIRRAIRYGYQLGSKNPFLYLSVSQVTRYFADVCAELVNCVHRIEKIIHQEEERFYKTLDYGMRLLQDKLDNPQKPRLDGEFCFKLYDCFGFPLDLTRQMANENGFDVDEQGFEALMSEQRARGRAAQSFSIEELSPLPGDLKTEFVGYEEKKRSAKIVALYVGDQLVEELSAEASEGIVVLDKTPFYAESGGQVGDTGVIYTAQSQFSVVDTQKAGSAWLHIGYSDGAPLKLGEEVTAEIDGKRRQSIARNHSATHLLHYALVKVLGDSARQCGSLVDERHTRFDFSHEKALGEDEIVQIEDEVNRQILENALTKVEFMEQQEAIDSGAKALFGERYSRLVRVLTIGRSRELCGGTHVHHTGDIGLFKVVAQSGIGSGVRRIEATTGAHVIERMRYLENITHRLSQDLGQGRLSEIPSRVRELRSTARSLDEQRIALNRKLFNYELEQIGERALAVGDRQAIVAITSSQDTQVLRDGMDLLKRKYPKAVVALASPDSNNEKVKLLVGVGRSLSGLVSAKSLIRELSPLVGGKGGGGRDDFAQAGGSMTDKLPEFISQAQKLLVANLR